MSITIDIISMTDEETKIQNKKKKLRKIAQKTSD